MIALTRLFRWPVLPLRLPSFIQGRRRQAIRSIQAMMIATGVIALAGTVWIEQTRTVALDREFAARLLLLQRERAAHPERPLFLVVGSSRMVMGFAPEQLPPIQTPDGRTATVFNFSHLGSGPVMNHLTLARLQHAGIRADWVILELMAGFLPKENAALVTSICTARDVAISDRYYRTGSLWWEYLKHRTIGLPNLARRALVFDDPTWGYGPLGSAGFVRESVDPALKARLMAAQERNFGFRLKDLTISEGNERAIRDSVQMLRDQGTTVHFLLSPEQEEFTRMYGPGKQAWFESYAHALAADLAVPLTDAREWLEPEDFEDGHHPLQRGRARFTQRLQQDVIAPMLASP
ncbi:MAG: hypothetical protein LC104_14190 [Bacteroidales bacterium]|nr:hypothetical protein [Bacteroidales bacterium]